MVKKAVKVSEKQMAMGFFCSHPEASEPVTGDPMPCNVARSTNDFCGLKAKYWTQIETLKAVPTPTSVIQLT